MTWYTVPHEIVLEAARQEELMGWPNLVPAYNTRSLRAAGYNIIRARIYRCQYLSLMGITDSTEHDLPFPFLPQGEKPR